MTDVLDFDDFATTHFPDRRVIQCNLTRPQSTASAGARAYVILTNPGSGSSRIEILLRTRGGRWIEKWQDIRTLHNFRPKTLPFGHPCYSRRLWGHDPEATAAMLNEAHTRETKR